MKAMRILGAMACAAALAAPVSAGQDGKKCTYSSQQCLDSMAEHCSRSGWVGVELEREEGSAGMTVTRVIEGSPAASAGLRVGDRLLALEGIPLDGTQKEKLHAAKKAMTPGTTVTYRVLRAGGERDVAVKLARMPESVASQMVGNHMLEHASKVESTTASK